MTYDMPDNLTRWYEILEWTHIVTGYWFGNVIVFAIFMIAFISMANHGTKNSFAAACFITSIIAVLFKVLGIINEWVLFVFLFLTGLSVVFLMINKD